MIDTILNYCLDFGVHYSHELIKVKIRAERDDRKLISEKIRTNTGAELIQTIGQIAVLYRLNPNK